MRDVHEDRDLRDDAAAGRTRAPARAGWRLPRRLAAGLLALTPWSGAAAASESVYGYLEYVVVRPCEEEFKAKLDTGATTSSIDARDVERFERDGDDWVRFELVGRAGQRVEVERPVVRWVRIKEHDGSHDRRPVVEMEVCLGRSVREVEVSLADRSEFNYAVLLGRNFLRGLAWVDSGRKYTRSPNCGTDPVSSVGDPARDADAE